jgi:hypothetical protein
MALEIAHVLFLDVVLDSSEIGLQLRIEIFVALHQLQQNQTNFIPSSLILIYAGIIISLLAQPVPPLVFIHPIHP